MFEDCSSMEELEARNTELFRQSRQKLLALYEALGREHQTRYEAYLQAKHRLEKEKSA